MDELLGAENNLGCSGEGGESDWVIAADIAGFKYIDGIVGFHYLSMPEENRPDGYTDTAIYSDYYHNPAPADFEQRIHPFMMADATDFVADDDGVILASAGELGALSGMAENAAGESCGGSCPLTQEDIDIAIETLRSGLEVQDPTRVIKMDFYLPLKIFSEANTLLLTAFIEAVNTEFIETGELQWATQRQVYEGYVTWNE
jgi:hypothetical protein